MVKNILLPAIKYEIHFADVSQSLTTCGFWLTQFLYAAKISGRDSNTEDILRATTLRATRYTNVCHVCIEKIGNTLGNQSLQNNCH
jgi:hypothetical protein